jgi:phosphate transport system protein
VPGRKSFHEQLAEAEARVVDATGLVLRQLDLTLRALETKDLALADVVISGDEPVDECYMDIERRILTLLATQAPVASDLRLVSAMLHINIHLERVADLCTNIAKLVKLTADLPFFSDIVQELVEMGRQAHKMLDTSIQAFVKRDLDMALALPEMDESIDRLNRNLFKKVAQRFAGDEDEVEWGSRMVLVSRQLERMGDHAVDIGEQVAFMITGEFREFGDASEQALIPDG